MRIVFLGLDGLDYDYAIDWHMSHLLQSQHSRIEVPIDAEKGAPWSPEVWASFLSGRRVKREFEMQNKWKHLLKLLTYLRKKMKRGLGLHLGQRILKVGGYRGFPDLKERSFLDLVSSTTINAPYYDYDHKCLSIFHQMNMGNATGEDTRKRLEQLFVERMREIKERIRVATEELVFAYMHFPDAIQHFTVFRNKNELLRHYMVLDEFAGDLAENVEADFFIILSDHGHDMERGHSNYGFYSCNVELEKKPTSIYDFYYFVQERAAR
jgi:hypothetical protein